VESEPLSGYKIRSAALIDEVVEDLVGKKVDKPMVIDDLVKGLTRTRTGQVSVTEGELTWSGLDSLFRDKRLQHSTMTGKVDGATVTKAEVTETLQAFDNGLIETRLSGPDVWWDVLGLHHQYVIPGGGTSSGELVITTADSRFLKQEERLGSPGFEKITHHYGESAAPLTNVPSSRALGTLDGVIGFARFSERRWKDPATGKMVRGLLIEEIQSDEEKYRRMVTQLARTDDEWRDNLSKQKDPSTGNPYTPEALAEEVTKKAVARQAIMEERVKKGLPPISEDLAPKFHAIDKWQEIVVQRVLHYAAEHDYDQLLINTSDTLNERYLGAPGSDVARGMEKFYDNDIPNLINKVYRRHRGEGTLDTDVPQLEVGGIRPGSALRQEKTFLFEIDDIVRLDRDYDRATVEDILRKL
jgi:hypothetical protein